MPPSPNHETPHFVAESLPNQPLPVAQLPDEAAPPCQNGLVLVRPPCPRFIARWVEDRYQAILARWRNFVWQLRHRQWLFRLRVCYEQRRGGGIGRSAVAGGRNGGIVGNEVTPSVRGTDGVTLLSTLPPSFRAIMEPNMIPKRCQNDLTIIAYLNYTVPHWLEMNYTVPYVVLVAFAIIGVWHTVWHLVKNTSAVAWFHDWVFGLLDDPTKPAPIRRWRAARRWGRGC